MKQIISISVVVGIIFTALMVAVYPELFKKKEPIKIEAVVDDHKADTISEPINLIRIDSKDTNGSVGYARSIDFKLMEETTKSLLNQYYKAGWLDARNEIIDLYNKGKFTDNNIERVMKKHWRKMESEIENRK